VKTRAMTALLILSLTATASPSATIVVDAGGAGDHVAIQPALDAASPGDTVLVRPGTYEGPPNRDLDFGGKDIALVSADGSASTIIDCGGEGRGFVFTGGETADALVRGFTVTNGRAEEGAGVYCHSSSPTLADLLFVGNATAETFAAKGGGMYCDASTAVLVNVTFAANAAPIGGGIYCHAADVTLTGVLFEGNHAADGGGGMYCDVASPKLTDVVFSGNSSGDYGGGLHCVSGSSPTLIGCKFSDNVAAVSGGAMGCWNASTPVLLDVTFAGNSAPSGGAVRLIGSSPILTDVTFVRNAAYRGGGIYCQQYSSPVLTHTTFVANEATYGGGLSCRDDSSARISNATFVANEATYGGGLSCGDSSPTLSNCIIAFNTGGRALHCDDVSSPTISRSYIFGNVEEDDSCGDYYDNVIEDPRLCDFDDDDVTLCADSPCLPRNNAWGELVGAHGQGCDACSTPVEATSWGTVKGLFR